MCERPAPPPKTALELFSRLLVLRRAAGLWSAPCGGVWLWAGDEWLMRFYRTLYLWKMNLRHSQTALGCLIVKPSPDVSKWDQPCQHLDWKCSSVLKNAEILKVQSVSFRERTFGGEGFHCLRDELMPPPTPLSHRQGRPVWHTEAIGKSMQ